jgi:hypothetical protein
MQSDLKPSRFFQKNAWVNGSEQRPEFLSAHSLRVSGWEIESDSLPRTERQTTLSRPKNIDPWYARSASLTRALAAKFLRSE